MFSRIPENLRPKVMYTNSGHEYWTRAAALLHVNPEGSRDYTLLDNERIYHFASGQHFVWPLHEDDRFLVREGLYQGNPLNYLVTLRALTVRLSDWVTGKSPPPDSQYPTLADGTLVAHGQLQFPSFAGIEPPEVIHTVYAADYGPRFREEGIIDYQPPRLLQEYFPLVSSTDRFGNEAAGVQTVELRVPLATYMPWILRHSSSFARDELASFVGGFSPLPYTAKEAAALEDSRPAILGLYTGRDDYRDKLRQAAKDMVAEGFMLAEDVSAVIERNLAVWDRFYSE